MLVDLDHTQKKRTESDSMGVRTYVGSHDGLNEHHPACNCNSDERDDVKHPDDIENDITWTTEL